MQEGEEVIEHVDAVTQHLEVEILLWILSHFGLAGIVVVGTQIPVPA